MTTNAAIERVVRHGAIASLKSEGFTRKGVRFYREFKPGIFHRVHFPAQRSSDADTTEFSMELGPGCMFRGSAMCNHCANHR